MNAKSYTTFWSLLVLAGAAWAQPMQQVDTSAWACEYCPEPAGFEAYILVGGGNVSDPSFKFADYSGLEDGGFLVLEGEGLYIAEGAYWEFQADDLGLDSRSLSVDGGRPGSWRVYLGYSELPHFLNDLGATPYSGVGSGDLTLPPDWVTAPNTQGMTALSQSLRPLSLETERKVFDLGLELTPPGKFSYAVDYQRQTKEGVRALGAGFMFTSTLLPAPVDYITDQVDASVTYAADSWQATVAYYGSFFENDEDRLRFDNPFNPVAPGASQGQFALEPDNEFHRISVSGFYRFSANTRVNGSLGFGRMDQDDRFLPYTVNPTPLGPTVAIPNLPRNSLEGEVDIVDLALGYDTRLFDRLGINVDYRYYDRQDDTPIDLFEPVSQDLFMNQPIPNRPYSFERHTISARGEYRIADPVRIDAGVEYEDYERTLDEPGDTDETSVWGRVRFDLGDRIQTWVRIQQQERDGARIDPASDFASIENPGLRKYYLADRDRDQVQGMLSFFPVDSVQIALSGGFSDDEYTDSLIGLTESDSTDISLDLAWTPKEKVSTHLFISREEIDAEIVGSEDFSSPDWTATTEDSFRTAGAGFTISDIGEKGIDFSMNYVYSKSEGDYFVNDSTAAQPFPTLLTRLKGWRMRANWPLSNGGELVFDYYREEYDSSDWQIDGVAVDEIFNVLTFGEFAPQYDIDVFSIWYRTGF